tara:strand:- start:38672 stop:39274 length:603 start_codon:yes stop_codon:yes gene_type:complete
VSVNINEFFSAFANDQKFFLNLPVLWSVTIDGVTQGSINSVLSEAGEKWQAKTSAQSMTKGGNILVAQSVVLPTEGSTFDPYPSGSSMGGFLPGYGHANRQNFLNDRQVSVNFLETEVDIEHNFFRPWAIALGIKGLVEDGVSLKGTMEVRQYSNAGVFIKGYRFNKIFPTAVEGYTLDYADTDFKIKSVTFACENYQQI